MPDQVCVYCGQPAHNNYSIHRDGFGVGPEVPLCDECGSHSTPTEQDIWERIAQPSADIFAFRWTPILCVLFLALTACGTSPTTPTEVASSRAPTVVAADAGVAHSQDLTCKTRDDDVLYWVHTSGVPWEEWRYGWIFDLRTTGYRVYIQDGPNPGCRCQIWDVNPVNWCTLPAPFVPGPAR